jgi:predicted TIM-barrel fold metal-dependent hydrolase
VHCHAFDALTPVTERQFLEELSLAAFMLGAYFPAGVYQQWRNGDADTRKRLNDTHQIEKRVDEVTYHFAQTVFVKFLVNELAAFLKCRPTLKDVVAARNSRGSDFWGYSNALLADAGYSALLIDTGYRYNQFNFKDFAAKLKAKTHLVFRLETGLTPLLNEQISLDELTTRFLARLRKELDDGHVGFKSYIASTGLDVRPWPREEVEKAWTELKGTPAARRQGFPYMPAKIVREHMLWQALDLAYERDVPVGIHCGNGEGPGVYLSHQYPYNLENVARFPVTVPQKPVKIVMVHGGYPHVDEAAYMSHIFTNVYYDISLMSPLVGRGLHDRFLNIFESVPMTKILHGSDAYNLPEFYFASAKWTKRYLASALAVLVDDGIYTTNEAIPIAKAILYDNTMKAYNLGS